MQKSFHQDFLTKKEKFASSAEKAKWRSFFVLMQALCSGPFIYRTPSCNLGDEETTVSVFVTLS